MTRKQNADTPFPETPAHYPEYPSIPRQSAVAADPYDGSSNQVSYDPYDPYGRYAHVQPPQEHGTTVGDEFSNLTQLLRDDGHYRNVEHQVGPSGLVDAEAVMRYIRQLTETGVRLRERVRLLEDEVDDLREGMQVERHARVCWLSTALQEATTNLHDSGRKRQRP